MEMGRHTAQCLSKIVCTLGPASEAAPQLAQLIDAGMNVARLNFSHGDSAWHRAVCAQVRELAEGVAIMGDLQGPKLRIGHMQDDRTVFLERGTTFVLTTRSVAGTAQQVSIDYPPLPREVHPSDLLYLNDGLIAVRVQEIQHGTDIVCEVVSGGSLSSRKGINAPRIRLSAHVPTEKDQHDIQLAVELGVDFLAVSFVAEPDDLHRVRQLVRQAGGDMPLISKIERWVGLDNFDAILEASDGIMVARGDLAVEIPTEEVPRHQKEIIRKCNQAGKPVICATQMLESMCVNPVPTRAEVSDVFNAILDGADAVMLSGESAMGAYPVESVEMMTRIVSQAEATLPWHTLAGFNMAETAYSESIGHGISSVVEHLTRRGDQLAAIVAITRSGYSARMIAKYRPGVPIIAVTNNQRVARQLVLQHGLVPMLLDVEFHDPAALTQAALLRAVQERRLAPDDVVLTVSGTGWVRQRHANFVGLAMVRDVLQQVSR
jgi:pyruvate kinase